MKDTIQREYSKEQSLMVTYLLEVLRVRQLQQESYSMVLEMASVVQLLVLKKMVWMTVEYVEL